MYDIKQFKPMLYTVLALGITGFAIAYDAYGLWLVCMLAIGLNAALVRSGRFVPMPRWLANAVTILAVLFIAFRLNMGGGPPLMFIGEFLVLLQLVKLYEQRANRDYAQLLVLSLLMMVAACIYSTILAFGVLMFVYLVAALYCCLIFHLKVEADSAKAAFAIPDAKISPAVLSEDRRRLRRSMRRLTAVISVHSVAFAAFVFLFFPRGAGQGMLGNIPVQASAVTGFSDRVSFGTINSIKQNEEVVAHVTLWRNDKPVAGTEPVLLLRGVTLDVYGAERRGSRAAQWASPRIRREQMDVPARPFPPPVRRSGDVWRQHVQMRTPTKYLFALQGVMELEDDQGFTPAVIPSRGMGIEFSRTDDSIECAGGLTLVDYQVYSLNGPHPLSAFAASAQAAVALPSRSDPSVLAQVRAVALLPEVAGDLIGQRPVGRPVHPLNETVARRIEEYLKTDFRYTLDLTDSRREFRDIDPVVAFLTRVKKGHCEFFASAMTLMCQSLDIPARMVVGFKCDEYNAVGGYYIVRQSHAHTWVEVLTPRGWLAFDPTSGREANADRRYSWIQSIRHFLDYLEYKWAENVVAFDGISQDSLLNRVDAFLVNAVIQISLFIRDVFRFKHDHPVTYWRLFFDALRLLIAVMVAIGLLAVAVFLVQKANLRRRAARIGLNALPMDQQLRLARQLRFYDLLTRALQRHSIERPPHLTPMEFAQALVFLPNQAYQSIRRLTGILYRVRFGGAVLNTARQRRLEETVRRIADSLEDPAAIRDRSIES